MSIIDYKNIKTIEMKEFSNLKIPMFRCMFPKLIAEDLCSVQPMTHDIKWEDGYYYTPYIPLGVHEYPEEKWLEDEDFIL